MVIGVSRISRIYLKKIFVPKVPEEFRFKSVQISNFQILFSLDSNQQRNRNRNCNHRNRISRARPKRNATETKWKMMLSTSAPPPTDSIPQHRPSHRCLIHPAPPPVAVTPSRTTARCITARGRHDIIEANSISHHQPHPPTTTTTMKVFHSLSLP